MERTGTSEVFSPRPGVRADLLLAMAVAAPLALAVVALSSLSVTWFVLLMLGLAGAVAIVWSGNIQLALAGGLAVTLPIDITKALIATNPVIYSPPLHMTLADVFLVPLLVLWVWQRKVVERARFRLSPFHGAALAFTAWQWFSALHSPQLRGGFCAAILYTKFFLLFMWLSDYLDTTRKFRIVLHGSLAGLAINILFTMAQFLTRSRLEIQGAKAATVGTSLVFAQGGGLHTLRPFGFLQHPNILAAYLVLVIPLLVLLIFAVRPRLPGAARGPMAALLLLCVGCLALTLSRGGWIACAAALAWAGFWGIRRRLINPAWLVLGGAVLALATFVSAALYPALYLRLIDSDERATESRVLMMEQSLLISRENVLLGVGLGGYNTLARYRIPASFASVTAEYQKELLKGIVHNKYLLLLAEEGIIGLALFVWLLARALLTFFSVKRWNNDTQHALALGLTAGLVGQAVFFNFDHFYVDVRMSLLFFVYGLLSALVRLSRS